MNSIRRLAVFGASLFIAGSALNAQVIERPVPFDSGAVLLSITPPIAERAGLRAPSWPVSGDFVEARLYTVTDSTYILTVTRRSGVVERYTLSLADREAIRASLSKIPRETLERRSDARNSFILRQSVLGLAVYAPAFAVAVADEPAVAVAGYLVVAGGTFFAASEISRDMFISRPQADLSFNMGHNGALAGWGLMHMVKADDNVQGAGAFVGGLTGAALSLHIARNMTEAEAVGGAFGSDYGALLGFGVAEALRGSDEACALQPGFTERCPRHLSLNAEIGITLASGLLGYPLGFIYPRNAAYHVTAGDVQTLWPAAIVGAAAAGAFLGDDSPRRATAIAFTAGGIVGTIAGDRFLVRRFDHTRDDGALITVGTIAGGLVGAGTATLIDTNASNHLRYGLAAIGALGGLLVTENLAGPAPDAGRARLSVTFNPASLALLAAHVPGNYSLLNVRF